MAMIFDAAGMRKRFHDNGAQIHVIRAQSAPVRAEYDALRAKQCDLDEQLIALKARILEIEAPIAALDEERGVIVRALKGKTGAA